MWVPAVEFDVILVLGAMTRPDGSASPALTRRLTHGVGLVLAGRGGALLVSGGAVNAHRSEAEVMAELALAQGLAPELLTLERRSRTTLENAAFSAPLIAAQGWRKVGLVTDAYHMPRAKWLFWAFGIETIACPASGLSLSQGAAMVREGLALAMTPWRLWRYRLAARNGLERDEGEDGV